MNAGAEHAAGKALLFLHADTLLPDGADVLVQTALASGQHVWGRFDVRIEGQSMWLPVVAALMNLRSKLTGIATGDQAIFMTHAAFTSRRGFAAQLLMEDIDMYDLMQRGPQNKTEELRIELFEKVNALGIGAQGLGGLTTVLDVKIATYPTHAAGKPVAMIPNCAATRHAHVTMDGSGASYMEPPSLDLWPDVKWAPDYNKSKKVDLNTLTREQVASWKPGDTLLLTGKMLTGRDAAHKRIQEMLVKGEQLPVDFTNRVIYYVGPVDPVRDEVMGPAGPTTATRMDKFTEMMLAQTGLIGMIGKAERGPAGIAAIQKHRSAYLMAVGGAAYLVAKAIKHAQVVGFADLGMEAIYEFDVQDMPVTVAVSADGTSVHNTGPKEWQARIGKIPVVTD